MLTSRDAQGRLLHDMAGHGLQQLLFARSIACAVPSVWPLEYEDGVNAAMLIGAYVAIVLVVAAILPPHRLPYLHSGLQVPAMSTTKPPH